MDIHGMYMVYVCFLFLFFLVNMVRVRVSPVWSVGRIESDHILRLETWNTINTRLVNCVSIMKLCTCFSARVSSSFRETTATSRAVQPAPCNDDVESGEIGLWFSNSARNWGEFWPDLRSEIWDLVSGSPGHPTP